MRRPALTLVLVVCAVAVLVAVSATDNFNRANDSTGLGTNWTCPAGSDHFNVDTNQARSNPSASHNTVYCYYATSAATFSANQYSEAKLFNASGTTVPVVTTRFSGTDWASGTGYYGSTDGTNCGIGKYTGSDSFTSLNTSSCTWSDGDTLRLEVSGTSLTLKQNGSTILTTTDSTYSSGQPGILAYDATGGVVRADDWAGSDIGGGATFPIAILNTPFRCCRR